MMKRLRSVLLIPPMGLMSALEQSYLVKYPRKLKDAIKNIKISKKSAEVEIIIIIYLKMSKTRYYNFLNP